MIKRIASFNDTLNFKLDFWFVLLLVASLPFKVGITNTIFVLYGLYILFCIVKEKKVHYSFSVQSFKATWFLSLLFLLLALSILYSSDRQTGLSLVGRLSPLILMPVLFSFLSFTTVEKKAILWAVVFSNLLALAINLTNAILKSLSFTDGHILFDASVLGNLPFWYSIVQGGNFFFYSEFSSFLHPTYWALYLQLCLLIIIENVQQNATLRKRVAYVGIFCVFLIAIFLCSARIILITTILIVAFYLIKRLIVNRSTYSLIAGLVLSAIIVSVIFTNPRLGVFSSLESAYKFNQTRLETWQSAVEVFKESPIFGTGIGDSENELVERYRVNGYQESYSNRYNEHNEYLHISSSIGIIGLTVFLCALGYGFKTGLTNKNYVQIGFIFFFAVVCMVENVLIRRDGVLFFAFFYSLLFSPDKEK